MKNHTHETQMKCAFCDGKGTDPFNLLYPGSRCQVCGGKGRVSKAVLDEKVIKCHYCHGTGKHPFTRMTCTTCSGRGKVLIDKKNTQICPVCRGTGSTRQENLPCSRCGGKGIIIPVHKHRKSKPRYNAPPEQKGGVKGRDKEKKRRVVKSGN